MMARLLILISCFYALFSSNAYSLDCPVTHPKKGLSCKGTFRARNFRQLLFYRKTLGFTKRSRSIKNLLIDFNYKGRSLSVATPCKIALRSSRKLLSKGNLCLNGERGISLGKKSITHAHRALTLKSKASVSVGAASKLLARNLNIKSNQNSNVGFYAFLAARDLTINSENQTRVSSRTFLKAKNLNLSGGACEVSERARIKAVNRLGSCFTQAPPVNTPPVASLTATPTSGTAPFEVAFNATDSTDDAGIVTYLFDFGDGETLESSTPTVTHTYTSVGVFTASIRVQDAENLESTASLTITSLAPALPRAFFNAEVRPNEGFIDLLNFAEDQSESTRELVEGFYEFRINDGEVQRREMRSLLQRTRERITVNQGDRIEVTQTIRDRLGRVATKTMNFNIDFTEAPILSTRLSPIGNNQVFLNLKGTFSPSNFLSGFTVDWGDGVIDEKQGFERFRNHQYPNSGQFTVRITVRDFQNLSTTEEFTVNIAEEAPVIPVRPVVDIGFIDVSSSFDYAPQFFGSTLAPDGSFLRNEWDLGDGTTSSSNPLQHFYTTPGTFEVSLRTTDPGTGLTGEQIIEYTVSSTGPDFVTDLNCFSQSLVINCQTVSLSNQEALTSVVIDYGDGTVSDITNRTQNRVTSNESHTYQSEGSFNITLTATRESGEVSITQREVFVDRGLPIAELNCSVIDGLRISCDTQGSFDPNGFIIDQRIDYGDGTVQENFFFGEHSYNESGDFSITLTITDNEFNETSVTEVISVQERVNLPPVIGGLDCQEFGSRFEYGCNAFNTFDPDGFFENRFFDFGDGSPIVSGDFFSFHTYQETGSFTVSFTLFDNDQASTTVTEEITILPNTPPEPVINCQSFRENEIECDAIGTTDDRSPQEFTYTFDDGTVITSFVQSSTVFHRFASGGQRNVTLTVTDDEGESASVTQTFNVIQNLPPVARFSCESTQGGGRVSCDGTSSTDDNGIIELYTWNIGGQTLFGPIIETTVQVDGAIQIELTVTDNQGQTGVAQQNILVSTNNFPIAQITADRERLPIPAIFNLSAEGSSDPDNDSISFTWLRNGVEISRESTLSLNSNITENIEIELVVTDSKGGVSRTQQFLTTFERPNVQILGIPEGEITIPTTLRLSPKQLLDLQGNPFGITWDYTGFFTLNSDQSITVLIQDTEVNNIRLIAVDQNGERSIVSQNITGSSNPLYFSAAMEVEVNSDQIANITVPLLDVSSDILSLTTFSSNEGIVFSYDGVTRNLQVDLSNTPELLGQEIDILVTNRELTETYTRRIVFTPSFSKETANLIGEGSLNLFGSNEININGAGSISVSLPQNETSNVSYEVFKENEEEYRIVFSGGELPLSMTSISENLTLIDRTPVVPLVHGNINTFVDSAKEVTRSIVDSLGSFFYCGFGAEDLIGTRTIKVRTNQNRVEGGEPDISSISEFFPNLLQNNQILIREGHILFDTNVISSIDTSLLNEINQLSLPRILFLDRGSFNNSSLSGLNITTVAGAQGTSCYFIRTIPDLLVCNWEIWREQLEDLGAEGFKIWAQYIVTHESTHLTQSRNITCSEGASRAKNPFRSEYLVLEESDAELQAHLQLVSDLRSSSFTSQQIMSFLRDTGILTYSDNQGFNDFETGFIDILSEGLLPGESVFNAYRRWPLISTYIDSNFLDFRRIPSRGFLPLSFESFIESNYSQQTIREGLRNSINDLIGRNNFVLNDLVKLFRRDSNFQIETPRFGETSIEIGAFGASIQSLSLDQLRALPSLSGSTTFVRINGEVDLLTGPGLTFIKNIETETSKLYRLRTDLDPDEVEQRNNNVFHYSFGNTTGQRVQMNVQIDPTLCSLENPDSSFNPINRTCDICPTRVFLSNGLCDPGVDPRGTITTVNTLAVDVCQPSPLGIGRATFTLPRVSCRVELECQVGRRNFTVITGDASTFSRFNDPIVPVPGENPSFESPAGAIAVSRTLDSDRLFCNAAGELSLDSILERDTPIENRLRANNEARGDIGIVLSCTNERGTNRTVFVCD